ncbi:MAG: hypothetical protein EBU88_13175 [Acidobacteria bacterium]|nr:hypothetical protein [Acidobacteriota bacterium]
MRHHLIIPVVLLVALSLSPLPAQVVPNRGLTAADLALARTLLLDVGGEKAQLVYSHRFDPIQRGEFDSLLVVYDRNDDQGIRETFAFIHRREERLIIALDPKGRVLLPGDIFLRIGIRRLPDQPPIVRFVGSFNDKSLGPSLRNVDYQFNRTDFSPVNQSVTRIPDPPRE